MSNYFKSFCTVQLALALTISAGSAAEDGVANDESREKDIAVCETILSSGPQAMVDSLLEQLDGATCREYAEAQ